MPKSNELRLTPRSQRELKMLVNSYGLLNVLSAIDKLKPSDTTVLMAREALRRHRVLCKRQLGAKLVDKAWEAARRPALVGKPPVAQRNPAPWEIPPHPQPTPTERQRVVWPEPTVEDPRKEFPRR